MERQHRPVTAYDFGASRSTLLGCLDQIGSEYTIIIKHPNDFDVSVWGYTHYTNIVI